MVPLAQGFDNGLRSRRSRPEAVCQPGRCAHHDWSGTVRHFMTRNTSLMTALGSGGTLRSLSESRASATGLQRIVIYNAPTDPKSSGTAL